VAAAVLRRAATGAAATSPSPSLPVTHLATFRRGLHSTAAHAARAVPSRFKAPARRRVDASEPSAPSSRNVPARTDGAPPPAQPPPPAPGGGGGLLATVAEGFSFGIGAALARSMVDSVMGSMGGGDSGGGADAATPPPSEPERSSDDGWGNEAQGGDDGDDEW
jgi:hypothetical protein